MITRRSILRSAAAGTIAAAGGNVAMAAEQSKHSNAVPWPTPVIGRTNILYIGGGQLARDNAESWAQVGSVGFDSGTPHLEYEFYEHLAIHEIIRKGMRAQRDGFDAVVIGCFYDPGLHELRELLRIPVVGVCEATLHVAAMMSAGRFSVLVGRQKWIPQMAATAAEYGFESRIASWRVLDLTVPDMRDRVKTKASILREAKRSISDDRAEVIALGCTGMAGQAREVQDELGIPVLDPVLMGLKVAEMKTVLWKRYAISHSKIGGYEAPPTAELNDIYKHAYGLDS